MRALNFTTLFVSFSFIILIYSCHNEPYEGPIITDNELSCSIASDLAESALNDFLESDSSNFEDNCLAYKAALEQQLLSCPEEADEILILLEELNNCELDSFFRVDFDNDTYLALSAEAHISDGKLTIAGSRDNEVFELILHETTEGTYQLGITDSAGDTNIIRYFPDISNSNESWVSMSDGVQTMGEITITEIDYSRLRISGTFNFTGLKNNETKLFTNGVFFDIPLTKENEFFALVDGVEFEDAQFLPFIHEDADRLVLIFINDDNDATMDFTLDVNTTPGVYNFRLIPELPRAGFTSNPEFYYYANGTLTITAHNTNNGFIMGSFEFNAELEIGTPQSYSITEGSFCLTYFH